MTPEAIDAKVYKELNAEIRAGLKDIYHQISAASSSTDALFQEATSQLDEVVKATESAAMDIMDIVEQVLKSAEKDAALLQELSRQYPGNEALQELALNNADLAQKLTAVLTALGFQDITGQRLKKVAQALAGIEKSVVDLYLASGLAVQQAEEQPATDATAIKAAAHKAVEDFRGGQSTLKGPDANGCNQAKIDNLLEQLGL